MRRATLLSALALCAYSAPSVAQTVLYDPVYPQPGQVYTGPQAPVYVDPNQPYNQTVPAQGFGQQPQPGFGQPLPQPQPNYGQPLPQPQAGYGQQLPQPTYGQGFPQAQPEFVPAPEQTDPGQPYYARTGTAPLAPEDADASDSQIAPAVQEAVEAAPQTASRGNARDRAPQMSEELAELVRVGERYRAASPGFLDDLKALAEKYRDPLPGSAYPAVSDVSGEDQDAQDGTDLAMAGPDAASDTATDDPAMSEPTTNEPVLQPVTTVEPLSADSISTVEYLSDDFTDGNFDLNPTWAVRQGDWVVDPVYGLRAKAPEQASSEPIRPKEVLNVLLGGDAPSGNESSQPKAALIEVPTTIANSFSLAARIVDHEGKGAAHFIMHQGGSDWLGYRLELRSGPQPVVVLTRRGSTGYKDITKVTAPGFTKGETHELRWARLSDGQMFVILDGQPIITSRDTVFRGDWSGFAFFNAGGDVSIRTIRIAQPIER